MPTYEYLCPDCGNRFEEYQSITAEPLQKCPSCGKKRVKRLIGTGAALIFKGSGFYQTDYRSESYQKSVKSESSGGAPAEATKNSGSASKSSEPKSSSTPSKTDSGGGGKESSKDRLSG